MNSRDLSHVQDLSPVRDIKLEQTPFAQVVDWVKPLPPDVETARAVIRQPELQ